MADHRRDNPLAVSRTLSLHQGANQRIAAYLLGETQGVDVENLLINTVGARIRRGGTLAFGGAGGAPGGIGSYNDLNFNEFMVGVWGDRVLRSSGNGGWAQIASAASIAPGRLHDFVRVIAEGNLAVAISNCQQTTEASHTFVYDIISDAGSSVSLSGVRCQASFQSRLWLGAGQDIFWSEIVAPASFSLATNNLIIEPGLGGDLTAIVPARDLSPRLWFFKERAVLVFEPRWGSSSALIPSAADALDPINSNLRVLTQGAGCIATRSAVWVPGAEGADLFFLSEDGVRSLRRAENDVQAGAGFPLSYSIPDWVDRITWAHAHKAVAAVHDNAYHLAVPLDGATDNTHILRFDIGGENQAWSLLDWQTRDLRTFRLGGQSRFFLQSNYRAGDSSVTDFDSSTTQPYQVYQGYNGAYDPSTSLSLPLKILWHEDSRAFTMAEGDPRGLTREKLWESLAVYLSSADTCKYALAYRSNFGPWTDLDEDTLPGTDGTVVLGETPLPWADAEDVVRLRTFLLKDIPPSRWIQFRLHGATGASDIGQPTIYQTELRASLKQEDLQDEN